MVKESFKIWGEKSLYSHISMRCIESIKRVGWKVYSQKSSYDYIIPAVDNVFHLWNPSSATLMEEVGESQRKLCWKINLIWLHSMRVS